MDLTVARVARDVAAADTVVPVGGRTHWQVGGAPALGTEVSVPAGVVRHDPADLTVTVGAGTSTAELDAVLAEHGQECVLDPRSPEATVGGLLAAGLSGHRRLRHGPLRDRVLEVRFVTADGRVVKGGGPTVKNVSGYDVPRLLVGSLGTLGVIVEATLRCQARPRATAWFSTDEAPAGLRASLFRPSCLAWDGSTTWCLLEGDPDDIAAEAGRHELAPSAPPRWPEGVYRGRASIRPGQVVDLGEALRSIEGLRWTAEASVGTVHLAADDAVTLEAARPAAAALGGWVLREEGADVEPFGIALPNQAVVRRLKEALDPAGKLNPGRLPL